MLRITPCEVSIYDKMILGFETAYYGRATVKMWQFNRNIQPIVDISTKYIEKIFQRISL